MPPVARFALILSALAVLPAAAQVYTCTSTAGTRGRQPPASLMSNN
jgi:hypothetical protein